MKVAEPGRCAEYQRDRFFLLTKRTARSNSKAKWLMLPDDSKKLAEEAVHSEKAEFEMVGSMVLLEGLHGSDDLLERGEVVSLSTALPSLLQHERHLGSIAGKLLYSKE